MKYFVCTIGNFDENVDILKECLSQQNYKLHHTARWPSPLSEIKKGDTLLLKIQNQLVAWGIAQGPVRIDPPDSNNGWNRVVLVEQWWQKDPLVPTNGVYHYGIQAATVPGAGQFSVVKEVESSWAEKKLEELKNTDNTLVEKTMGGECVTCQQLSLGELFRLPLAIPDYQRCFCWKKRNVTDILETLRELICNGGTRGRSGAEIHLGTIILKQESNTLFIVDGQQRLITLTMLAFCLYKENTTWPLLQASLSGTSNDAISARKHLCWAKATINEWLERSGLQQKGDSNKECIEALLSSIRFCVVILPQTASEDLAYTFFNAVNSSGKKLSDYDLLKAHHLRFIADESIAKSMAERWDATGSEGYDDILHKTLYRLRTWMRNGNPVINAQDGHSLFMHFSAKASTIDGLFFPPLSIRFNSTIHGGAPFFHYAEQYRMLLKDFQSSDAYLSLIGHLSGHSKNILRDSITAILFIFYCKFGRSYLGEALFCIADVVSVLRNEPQVGNRAIHKSIIKDCLFSLDAALDPGQFFDWCLSPERQYSHDVTNIGNTQKRYWEALASLYDELQQQPQHSFVLSAQCSQRNTYLKQK